jgi:hypothetical protein
VIPNFGGESRMQRFAEFTKVNPGVLVIGLHEGSALRVIHGVVTLLGPHPAKVFPTSGADRARTGLMSLHRRYFMRRISSVAVAVLCVVLFTTQAAHRP